MNMNEHISIYQDRYIGLRIKRNLCGDKALNAVEQDGYALQYVEARLFDAQTAQVGRRRDAE